MANAIENAACVLVCMTEKYKVIKNKLIKINSGPVTGPLTGDRDKSGTAPERTGNRPDHGIIGIFTVF